MNIKILFAILVFNVCEGLAGFSQITVVPSAADACVCSGSVSYTSSVVAPAVFNIYNYQGNLVTTINSPNGQFSLANLCPQPYSIVMTQNNVNTTIAFNVAAGSVNPGVSTMLTVCSTEGTINLNNQIAPIVAGGAWYDPSGNTITNVLNASTAMDGWYTYRLPVGGCNTITGVLVDFVQNANPGLSTTYLICEDYSPFQLLTVMTGMPDIGGQWTTAAGVPMDGWFYPATMNSQLFNYTINNVPGCGPVNATMYIMENLIPSPGTNASIVVCNNSAPFNMNSHLGGSPQVGGTWYNALNAPVSNIFNPAIQPAGVYRYHLNGQTPCTSQESFLTISFAPANPSGTSNSVVLCAAGSPINMIDSLNGSPMTGGTWRNSANQIVDGIFNPTNEPAGNYTYYYPNVGCSSVQTTLAISLEQLHNAGNDGSAGLCSSANTFNLNSMLSSNAQTGGVWTNASGTIIPSVINVDANIPTQQYTYTVVGTACPNDAASFIVTVGAVQPGISNQSLSFCATDPAVVLSDYYPGFPAVIFTNQSGVPVSANFDPATQGSIILNAVNPSSGGCPGSQALMTITVEQPAFQSATESIDICQSAVTFDLNSTSSTINFQNGHWENESNTQVSNQVNLDFTGLRTFEFISDNQQICAASSFIVNLVSYEQYTAGDDNSITLCNNAPSQTLVTMAGSLGTGNGVWYFANNPITQTSFNPAFDTPGIYQYIVPANGPCPSMSSDLGILVQYGINYSAGNDVTSCFGSMPVMLGQAGVAGTTYQWSPAANLSSTSSASPTVNFYSTNNTPSSITYTVVVNDGICTIQDQIVVTTLPRPVSNLPNEIQICRGETVSLSIAGNNISCQWSPAALFVNGTGAFQMITPSSTTEVEVMITNEWDCIAYDTALITVHQLPIVSFVAEAIPGCPPLQVHYAYYPTANESVSWSIPSVGNFYGNELNTVLYNTGIYDLTLNVTSAFGCVRTVFYSEMMEVYPVPHANFETTPVEITTVDPVATFINTSLDAESYYWNFSGYGSSTEVSPSFEFPNEEPTVFTTCLVAENEFTCKDTLCDFLPLDNIYIFYAPNAITADGDHLNDGFRPSILGFEESTYSLRIYNRWGEKIFETHDVHEYWMGNSQKGEYYVPEGVYLWRVEVKEKILANFKVFEGYVTVVR